MDRQFFFFFISFVDSFVAKIDRLLIRILNSSVHQKKKISVAWSSYDFADFLGIISLCLGYAQLDHRHHAIIILRL